jgi:predicted nuclease of restriction endonuclease-like (RecB) superfamily
MAPPFISINSEDPIAQAMALVDLAQEAYNEAGGHRNFLEKKAKSDDADATEAALELPAAQAEVERAQKNLINAQRYLAQLTGSDNPHPRQNLHAKKFAKFAAPPAPKKKEEKPEKTSSPAPEKLATLSKKPLPVRGEMERASFVVEPPIMRASVIEFLNTKEIKKDLERYQKNLKNLEDDLKKIPSGEQKIDLPRELFRASLMEYYRAPVAADVALNDAQLETLEEYLDEAMRAKQ